jgi:hypothetical protein
VKYQDICVYLSGKWRDAQTDRERDRGIQMQLGIVSVGYNVSVSDSINILKGFNISSASSSDVGGTETEDIVWVLSANLPQGRQISRA